VVVDTSAIVALLLGEETAPSIAAALADASDPVVSAATLVEATIVVESRLGPAGVLRLEQVVRESDIAIVDVTEDIARTACDAWRSFGKGRHPAALNFGDCFSYALASRRDEAVLCVGNDFAQTDIGVVSLVDPDDGAARQEEF